MKCDLDLYVRAKEGTPTPSRSFLIQSIRDLLRVRRNRGRIAKSHGEKFGACAPKKEGTRPQSGGCGRPSTRDSSASQRSRSSSRDRREDVATQGSVPRFSERQVHPGSNCRFLHKNGSRSPKPPDKTKTQKVCMYWKKESALEAVNADSCISLTKTGHHRRLDQQEQKTLPPQHLKGLDLLHCEFDGVRRFDGQRREGQGC